MKSKEIVVKGYKCSINKEYVVPGDKSIAHRALLIGALCEGKYTVTNFPKNLDCMATLDAMSKLGVEFFFDQNDLLVKSPGYKRFNKKINNINCKNSGTTARILSGVLAALNIETKLIGDNSLSKRPMKRVIDPLNLMGANILSNEYRLPIYFKENSGLTEMEYSIPVPSAQVKSCIILAGFLSNGITKVTEPLYTRDHTERLLKYLEADIEVKDNEIQVKNSNLRCKNIHVPGDVSSAAYLIACAILGKDCKIKIKDILLNERRKKYLDIIKDMGGKIEYHIEEIKNGEDIGYITAESSNLTGINIKKEVIPYIIDEIPVLSVLASFADGKTLFESVEELKYKESDRVDAIVTNLRLMDKKCNFDGENLSIEGKNDFINKHIDINTFNDHRIALSFLCSAMRNTEKICIDNWECTVISFPDAIKYFKDFMRII